MSDGTGRISWYDPDPRAIFPLERLSTPSRLARYVRNQGFEFSIDRAFEQVIRGCAERRPRWISEEMIRAYAELHREGHAHSVETWRADEFLGGVYGVAVQGVFFGESMFSLVPNASKAGFFHLGGHLQDRGFELFDTQIINDHTRLLGAVEIPRSRFKSLLRQALAAPVAF